MASRSTRTTTRRGAHPPQDPMASIEPGRPEPGQPDVLARPSDLPEDVRAELDTDERRSLAEAVLGVPAVELPEDVLAERDLEARLGAEETRQRLSEGRSPAEEGPRS